MKTFIIFIIFFGLIFLTFYIAKDNVLIGMTGLGGIILAGAMYSIADDKENEDKNNNARIPNKHNCNSDAVFIGAASTVVNTGLNENNNNNPTFITTSDLSCDNQYITFIDCPTPLSV